MGKPTEQPETQKATVSEQHVLSKMYWLASQLASLKVGALIIVVCHGEAHLSGNLVEFDKESFGLTLQGSVVNREHRKLEEGFHYIHAVDIDRLFVYKAGGLDLVFTNKIPKGN